MRSGDPARASNRTYDHATGEVWQQLVYDAVHGGWAFANICGKDALDWIGGRAAGCELLELCCGCGDTCRYLAERFGCRVTGIEMNANQVRQARRRWARLPVEVRTRLRCHLADVADWQAPRLFDAAYLLDSLMLLPDPPTALGQAFRHVRPGGAVYVTAVAAGPDLGEAVRSFAEADGMPSLLPSDRIGCLLAEAGFRHVEERDDTDRAARCFATIAGAAAARGNEAGRRVDGWLALSVLYRDAFRSGELAYSWFAARRP
jgi:SAM-dependent methyltransferase